MDKPLPDRIRPLEGVGFHNLMQDAGYSRRREWRWVAPICVGFAVVVAALILLGW